jgi:hypothetical protein
LAAKPDHHKSDAFQYPSAKNAHHRDWPDTLCLFRDNRHFYTTFDADVNPHLAQLQPYPFEKLRALFAGVTPNPQYKEIKLSIGEPQHATPPFIMDALAGGLKGLANYPTTAGHAGLRQAIAAWCQRRYSLAPEPGNRDPAGQWLARGPVFVCADGDRPEPWARAAGRQPQPVLSDLRRAPPTCRAPSRAS